jgi:radical SAM-linked protein
VREYQNSPSEVTGFLREPAQKTNMNGTSDSSWNNTSSGALNVIQADPENEQSKTKQRGPRTTLQARYLLRFSILGDLRFISHRDTMRLFERALLRAKLPVQYSEGFNPHVRLSLPLPRSVGIAARNEVLIFGAKAEFDSEEALERMRQQSPVGLDIRSLAPLEAAKPPQPVRAVYELDLASDSNESDRPDSIALSRAVEELRRSETWPIERATGGNPNSGRREIDLRAGIEDIDLQENRLRMILHVRQTGSPKPAEVLNVLGLPAEHWTHRLTRMRIDFSPPLPD